MEVNGQTRRLGKVKEVIPGVGLPTQHAARDRQRLSSGSSATRTNVGCCPLISRSGNLRETGTFS